MTTAETRGKAAAAKAPPMRTGAQFLASIRGDGRRVYFDGELVRDVTTRLHIFDRAIELVNPRRSAGFAPAALKGIRFGVQQRLNPRVAAIFSNEAYGLQPAHGGLPMMLREARAFSNRLPEIVSFNDEFRLRIHGV